MEEWIVIVREPVSKLHQVEGQLKEKKIYRNNN